MNFIISVCKPQAAGTVLKICSELQLPLTAILHGRGTAARSMLDLLGIEGNEKRVIFAVANRQDTEKLITLQKERTFVGVPGHGIVIAVPIKSVGGGKTVEYLNKGPNAKYTPAFEPGYELIIAMANAGFTDDVMNAARAAGAAGGTVLHAKGTGTGADERFLKVSLAQEKETILIVARAAAKAGIMRSILEKAGPDTEAGALVFSLPVSAVAGFGLLEG